VSFLLDTNICSAHLKDERQLFSRFMQHSGNLFVSRIGIAELYAWANLSSTPESRFEQIDRFKEFVEVLEFDDLAARHFGRLRVELPRSGRIVPTVDLLIASTALAHDLTLVTHNLRDFVDIPDLRTSDWLAT